MPLPIVRSDLLPPNSTAMERALSQCVGRFEDIDAPIDLLWNADACPSSHLPWLAWALSVDFWNDAWPIERKREICKRSFELHRLKGTLAGIKQYLFYADSALVRSITPPQEIFWSPEDTANLDAWKASLPQLRIYPFRMPGMATGFYQNEDFFDDNGGAANGFYEPDQGPNERGRRAVLWRNGNEIELPWLQGAGPFTHEGIERFGVPGLAPVEGLYFGDGFFSDYLSADEADLETVSLQRSGAAEIITSGYKVTNVTPEMVSEAGEAEPDVFYMRGGFCSSDYFAEDEAPLSHYERFYLFKPEKRNGDPDGWSYFGDMRFGMEAYTAELLIEIPEKAPIDMSFDDLGGFYMPQDLSRLWSVADALLSAKSARDKILIDTQLYRTIQFNDLHKFGNVKYGQKVRAF